MKDSQNDNLREAIEKSGLSHSIMIWGANRKGEEIVSVFSKWGFSVCGYVDINYSNIKQFNGYDVYSTDQLKENRYFVYVALQADYRDVTDLLEALNYQEFINYWYPRRIVNLDGTKNYQDRYGNLLITENGNPVNVCLRDGGEIIIHTKALDQTSKITSEGNSRVEIESNVSLGEKTVILSTNGNILIGKHCKFDSYIKLRCSSGGFMQIGDNCTIQRACSLYASFDAKVVLGEDCMLSYSVFIRAGNSHNIIDLNTLVNLDDNSDRDVVIGKHVWIGMRATIMNGVRIGAGATVGADSFVIKNSYPCNCCIAGNPVRVIRERTAWLRDGVTMHKDIDDYTDYIFD